MVSVPFQHHFNSRSARQIFALAWGPGIDRGRVVDRPVEQCQVARTAAAAMRFELEEAEGLALEEVFV